MTPVDWLLRGLAPLVGRRWGADCPAGSPVPEPERCAAVDCDSVQLTMLAEGEWARVTCLEAPGCPEARKLAALGILPGVGLVLLQRAPVFVFRMGHAELALDAGLAARVRVRRERLDSGPRGSSFSERLHDPFSPEVRGSKLVDGTCEEGE